MDRILTYCTGQRIALFLDGHYLACIESKLGRLIDYAKIRNELPLGTLPIRAFYYLQSTSPQNRRRTEPRLDWLRRAGFTIVQPSVTAFTEKGRLHRAGIPLACDMIDLSPHIHHAVLFGADRDYTRLIEYMQRRGRGVTVVSLTGTSGISVDTKLRRQADHFLNLEAFLIR